ncbi:hypothetical protein [Marinobacterium litorale]|uniref:hypothetical protein n=1 Tax=Marinobacterium litorale TaxID=404770 RepID=UPI0012EC95A6|nr:hypothetical protein [Marinobacterium litorale]
MSRTIHAKAVYFARATLDDDIPESVREAGIALGAYAIKLLREAQQATVPEGYVVVPVESPDKRPPYGQPILVALRGVWQHVTYTRDGSDHSEDWVEPYHFDHDDNTRAWWREVTAWVLVENLPEITAAQEDQQS